MSINQDEVGYVFAPWLPIDASVTTYINPYKDENGEIKSKPLEETYLNKKVSAEYYETIIVDNSEDLTYNSSENFIG